jgi:methionyl aminopeptidase
MEKEEYDNYMKAGSIVVAVEAEARKKLKPGAKILDIAEFMEKSVIERGGSPAFPVNISINEIAAHYTPSHDDSRKIAKGDLVKVDLGVHVDGYIADRAFTYCSEDSKLITSVEKALDKAISVIKPGLRVSEIGNTIEDSVKGDGFGLIVNLTGHGLDRFKFHGDYSIPMVRNDASHILREGEVIALEPFVLESNGHVKEAESSVEIYRYFQDRPVRLLEARQILGMSREEYASLPFARRWLVRKFSPVKVSLALRQLESVNSIEKYPVLREVQNRPIAQAEHTIIVAREPVVTTRKP